MLSKKMYVTFAFRFDWNRLRLSGEAHLEDFAYHGRSMWNEIKQGSGLTHTL